MSKRIVFLIGILASLIACRDDSLSQIGGYYQGDYVNAQGNIQQVTTNIPNLKDISEEKSILIEITPTLASASPQPFKVRYEDEDLFLKSRITNDKEVRLKVANNCASGVYLPFSVELCWNENRFSLKYKDKMTDKVNVGIYLVKEDTLLPAPNKGKTTAQ